MEGKEEIGQRLRILRQARTQKRFAQLLNIPFGTYVRYETGDRLPPPRVLTRISDYCAVSIDWILTGQPSKTEPGEKFPTDARKEILETYQYRCIVCGFGVESILRIFHLDLFLQGTDALHDIVVLCPNCFEMFRHRMIPEEALRLIQKKAQKKK